MIEIKEMVKPWVVSEIRNLSDIAFVIRFNRNGMDFKPGQHLVAGLLNSKDAREYSIYSGVNDPYLEILVREVDDGIVSKSLRKLKKGDVIEINGPYGFFMYNTLPLASKKFLFIASGTGIAPFHSFAKSYPDADYKIIHGIPALEEAYDKSDYAEERYFSCTSRDDSGDFSGRLTDYLQDAVIDPEYLIYFCGNSNMILEGMEILQKRGISQSRMFTEVYF